ncbi:MAG: hypothetical protein KTR31_24525 [Myxococcales bacterium]|nr:hypothetical protein [Myxococcales bacterium]
MNRWTTWTALLLTSALPLVGCGGSGACETMTVTVTVVNTDDEPLPMALVSYQGLNADPVECPQVEGNTFECDVPTDGDYNVYAELENHNGAAQRVTPDCEADEAPSVVLRMDTRIGGV